MLDTTASSLTGKLGSKGLKIASVSGVTATRNGFGTNVAVKSMKLTGKVAKELNKKLGFSGKQEEEEEQARLGEQDPAPLSRSRAIRSSAAPRARLSRRRSA